MQFPKDQRVVLAVGALGAVVLGVVIAAVAVGDRGRNRDVESPASREGLQLEMAEAPAVDGRRRLRCTVDGEIVGEMTLDECARRNGVATNALDVGLDESGALIAAQTASLAPPPVPPRPIEQIPTELPAADPAAPASAPVPAVVPTAACLSHDGAQWTTLSASMGLNDCVQRLFSGVCERPGGARYGRWGELTLRLVPRRVEQSSDNRNFRTLVEQNRDCSIPMVR